MVLLSEWTVLWRTVNNESDGGSGNALPTSSDAEGGGEMSPECLEHFLELIVGHEVLSFVVPREALVVHGRLLDEVRAAGRIALTAGGVDIGAWATALAAFL